MEYKTIQELYLAVGVANFIDRKGNIWKYN